MDKELAKLAMQFLIRVNLQGQEVPAFNAVMTRLNELAASSDPEQDVPQPAAHGGNRPETAD